MSAKISILGVILLLVSTNSEETSIFEKNGLTFKVKNKTHFAITDESIPILHQEAITDISEMEELLLSSDSINIIKAGAFQNLPNLRKLRISDNSIASIEVGVFNDLKNVTSLDLRRNGIKYIASHAFDNMTNLKSIDVSFNKLRKWDVHWFNRTPYLETYSLANNLFTQIPANAFGEQERTRGDYFIDFSENPTDQIDDDAFKNVYRMTALILDIHGPTTLTGNFLKASFKRVTINIYNVGCLDDEQLDKVSVPHTSLLVGYDFDNICEKKITRWATRYQKNVHINKMNLNPSIVYVTIGS